MIAVNGTLYGTTSGGGSGPKHACAPRGCGTIFSVSTAGTERVLHSFAGEPNDGSTPEAGLTDAGGALYGTTSAGGSSDDGTVFKSSLAGKEKLLYVFKGYADGDGDVPAADLVDDGSTLYGTTRGGGASEYGTVFDVGTAGGEKVLYSFGATGHDGQHPSGGVIGVGAKYYGATSEGGANASGTIYSVTASGKEKVLYSFATTGGVSPPEPYPLVDVAGTLYGVTSYGGVQTSECPLGCGTIFSIATSGEYKLLYSFMGGSDGAFPEAGLVDLNGKLYGTTVEGGTGACGSVGCGTIFEVTTSGSETVLYSFKSGASDGSTPNAAMTALKGTLYGTTYNGGAHGFGTIFSIKP